MTKKKKKSKLRINAEYYIASSGIFLAGLIPLRPAYFISKGLMRLFYVFGRKHRKRTIDHLLHSGVVKTREEAEKMAKKNYDHFARFLVEVIKMKRIIKPENIERHIKITGSEKAREMFFNKEKGSEQAIILSAHYGTWELLGVGYTLLSGNSLLTTMRSFDNPKLGNFFYKQRENDTHQLCDKHGCIKNLLKALREKKSACLFVDQHANSKDGVETKFFGHPARTHASPALLHLKTGIPLLVMVLKRVTDNFQFEFVCKDPISITPTGNREQDVANLAQQYTTAIEEIVQECPEQWMWTARRWLNINR